MKLALTKCSASQLRSRLSPPCPCDKRMRGYFWELLERGALRDSFGWIQTSSRGAVSAIGKSTGYQSSIITGRFLAASSYSNVLTPIVFPCTELARDIASPCQPNPSKRTTNNRTIEPLCKQKKLNKFSDCLKTPKQSPGFPIRSLPRAELEAKE